MERSRRLKADGVVQLLGAGVIAALAAAGAMQAPSAAESSGPAEVAVAAAVTERPAPVESTTSLVVPSTAAPATTASTTSETTATTAASTTAAPTTTLPSTTVPPTTVAPTPASDIPAPSTTVAPANRPAPTLIEATSTSRVVADHERRGVEALARIDYDWASRLPGWTIEFHPGRSGLIGLTFTSERRIEIYVRDSLDDSLLTHVIAHELGHAVDLTLNSIDDRERWREARDIADDPWWPGNGANDFSTGAGDFAEAFAEWQTGAGHHRSRLGGPATGAQLDLLIELATS